VTASRSADGIDVIASFLARRRRHCHYRLDPRPQINTAAILHSDTSRLRYVAPLLIGLVSVWRPIAVLQLWYKRLSYRGETARQCISLQ